eukprot:11595080-Heterocapsa_arctica.AAC.1
MRRSLGRLSRNVPRVFACQDCSCGYFGLSCDLGVRRSLRRSNGHVEPSGGVLIIVARLRSFFRSSASLMAVGTD